MGFEVVQGNALLDIPRLVARGVVGWLCVSDPPYGTGGWRRTEPGKGDDPSGSLIVEEWDDGATEWLGLLPSVVPVMTFWPAAKTRELLNAAVESGRTKHRALYMRKPDPKPQVSGRTKWGVEPVWVLSEDGFLLYGGDDVTDDMSVAQQPRLGRNAEATGHPYQKPVDVMRWLIAKTDAETIFDPYMGSGTTGVAALLEGRNFIGIEQDPHWCAVAEARMLRASGVGVDIPRLPIVGRKQAHTPLFEQAVCD